MTKHKLIIGSIFILAMCTAGALWLRAKPAPAPVLAPSLGQFDANPKIISVNTATTITATVQITDPTLVPNGVNLIRRNSNGSQTILGVMHDDGLNGDPVSGDKLFTLQKSFNEAIVGQFQLQVSVAFRGQLQRVLSAPLEVDVWLQYSNPTSPISMLYPQFPPNVSARIDVNSNNTTSLMVLTPSGEYEPVFSVSLASIDRFSSLSDWFTQNIDSSGSLLVSTYTEMSFNDGRIILLLTGAVPGDWDGGSIAQAYIFSPDKSKVATVYVSQDNPLDHSMTSDEIETLVNNMVSTIQIH